MIALPDVNVLLALVWSQPVHHHAAHAWFSQFAGNGWSTCLLTQSAFLRLSLNPRVVHAAIDVGTALDLLKGLLAHPNHQFLAHGLSMTSEIFETLVPRISGYRQMTDATLLLVARAHGIKLITFDQSVQAICPWPENLEILSS